MKRLITFLLLSLTTHLSYAQACGVYRIKYTGIITSDSLNILSIQLPTTEYLHKVEKENSKSSWIDIKLMDGKFDKEIQSHLTTPYTDKNWLVSYYKSNYHSLKVKVLLVRNGVLIKTKTEIGWDKISVSVINDNKFGTLFEFDLGNIQL